ncbi:MAG: CDGSH iron-sulfur domain-containing protein, partial [Cucumibacter sp.]
PPPPRVFIHEPQAARVLDLANATYGHMLRCLTQAWGRHADDQQHKRMLVDTARELMGVIDKVAGHLASLPAGKDHPGVNAGITFTMLRDLQRVPTGVGELRMLGERVVELSHHAAYMFPAGHELAGLPERLMKIAEKFELPAVGAVAEKPKSAPQNHDVPIKNATVESAEGKELTVNYEGKRCIHARFCVLGAPSVFKANTPGEWIFPDTMPAEELIHVVKNCPSGALTYAPKGDIAAEGPPPVNTAHLRENGPYAFHAPMRLKGVDIGFRATLCRCGASKRKPFCDSSHHDIGFSATGEPETRNTTVLAIRDGELSIEPEPNGPLVITGNLEICAGTGRTIDRVTRARLCRCGASHTKPFCDNTHKKIGFLAD